VRRRLIVSFLRHTLLPLGLCGLMGCSTYHAKVEAVSRAPSSELTSFRIRSRDPSVQEDSLRFKETAERVRTALSAHGLWEAPNANSADMVIDIDYGVGEPRTTYERTSVPSITLPAGRTPASPGSRSPTSGVVEFHTEEVPVVVRDKYLTVTCRENKPAAEGRLAPDLWRVNVRIEDKSSDLRDYLPVLASTVMERLGQSTEGEIVAHVRKSDDAVDFVRKGM
jgi:hypothetical protein